MRIYNSDNCELFYISVYARMRLVPDGMVICHTLTLEEVFLHGERRQISCLWEMLEKGASRKALTDALSALGNGSHTLFAVLIAKGMIE